MKMKMKKPNLETVLIYGVTIAIVLFKAIGLIIQIRQTTHAQQVIPVLCNSLIPPVCAFLIWYLCLKHDVLRHVRKAIYSYSLLIPTITGSVIIAGILWYDPLLFPVSGILILSVYLQMGHSFSSGAILMTSVCMSMAYIAAFIGHDLLGAAILIMSALTMLLHSDQLYDDFSYFKFAIAALCLTTYSVLMISLNQETIVEIFAKTYDAPQAQYLLSHLFDTPVHLVVPLAVVPPLLVYFVAFELAYRKHDGDSPLHMGVLDFLVSHTWAYWALSIGCFSPLAPMELMGGTFIENLILYLLIFIVFPPHRLFPHLAVFREFQNPCDMDVFQLAEEMDISLEDAVEMVKFMEFAEKYNKAMERLPVLIDYLSKQAQIMKELSDEDPA